MLTRLLLAVTLSVFSGIALALDSDADQPATLEANDFEIDLKTGRRIYRGGCGLSARKYPPGL